MGKVKVRVKSEPKTSYSCDHVLERAKERYDVILTPEDYTKLNELVQAKFSGYSLPLSSDKDTEIYTVSFKNENFIAVFHKTDHCVTTLLPPGTNVVSRRNRSMK